MARGIRILGVIPPQAHAPRLSFFSLRQCESNAVKIKRNHQTQRLAGPSTPGPNHFGWQPTDRSDQGRSAGTLQETSVPSITCGSREPADASVRSTALSLCLATLGIRTVVAFALCAVFMITAGAVYAQQIRPWIDPSKRFKVSADHGHFDALAIVILLAILLAIAMVIRVVLLIWHRRRVKSAKAGQGAIRRGKSVSRTAFEVVLGIIILFLTFYLVFFMRVELRHIPFSIRREEFQVVGAILTLDTLAIFALIWIWRGRRVQAAKPVLVGTVRSFHETAPNPLNRRQVWDFQVETADSLGNLVFRSVQMRAKSFEGRIEDGHKVEVFGEWRQGTLQASKVHDLDTDAWIIGI